MPDDAHDRALFGAGLLGEALAPKRAGNLADRFILPPFSVLSARGGWWQNRKRAWIALGIKSELGRGESAAATNVVAAATPGGFCNAVAPRPNANPGGSLMSSMSHSEGRSDAAANVQAVVLAVPLKTPSATRPQAPALGDGRGAVTIAPALSARQQAPQAPVTLGPRALKVTLAPTPVQKPLAPMDDPFLARHAARLAHASGMRLNFDEAIWSDPAPDDPTVFLDVEVFSNFFVCCLKRPDGRRAAFEASYRCPLDADGLKGALKGAHVVTFNGAAYDIPILIMALRGDAVADLKSASDQIIRRGMKPWETEKAFDVRLTTRSNHIDLVELSVHASLKVLYGRLHGGLLVDLPFDPDATLTAREMNVATLYCMQDLDATEVLFAALADRIALRERMGAACGLDLRSKSDAQMGEAIVRRRIEQTRGARITRREPQPVAFRYRPPPFARFDGLEMRGVMLRLEAEEFRADAAGEVTPPEFLRNLTVTIAGKRYAMGVGGLHSQEERRALVADDEHLLLDVDVSSHYPRIILGLGTHPPNAGPAFLEVYRSLMDERLEAKAAGDKIKADDAKIALNGVFGKLGSPYSFLYAPDMLVATTLTGQLSILMLIERAEAAGVEVASANTDGVLLRCRRDRLVDLDALIADWEADTEFATERQEYRAVYTSSVNSYLAIRKDGKVKRRGPIADPWRDGDLRAQMAKNPQMTVLGEAVERLAKDRVPIEETVRSCRDVRAFVTLIRVTGGAVWRDRRLGRAVRYYWSTDGEPIGYASANRKVAKTDGARPMMELPAEMPADLDLDRYVAEATKMARDYAVIPEDEGPTLTKGLMR